jgi:uncharacterized protein YbjQ (UPF0145 family)
MSAMNPATVIVTTANEIQGRSIVEYKGVVRGLVVRATSVVSGIAGGLRSLFGGNIEEFEHVCEQARDEAFRRMVAHARQNGADAIIAMRYDATEFVQGSTEVLAYGTAVKLAR